MLLVGPQISELISDPFFEQKFKSREKPACISQNNVDKKFLGTIKLKTTKVWSVRYQGKGSPNMLADYCLDTEEGLFKKLRQRSCIRIVYSSFFKIWNQMRYEKVTFILLFPCFKIFKLLQKYSCKSQTTKFCWPVLLI